VLRPNDARPREAEIAVSPGSRSAMLYALDPERRDAMVPELEEAALQVPGVDLVIRKVGEEAVVRSERGELRFGPDGRLVDLRGARWSVEGESAVLDLRIEEGVVTSPAYPDPLGRIWSSLHCPGSGDVLLSAGPGYEFVDWGGADHVGGGAHGSLHAVDSLGVLLWCGTGPEDADAKPQWTIRDAEPMVLDHFEVPRPNGGQASGARIR
jgi:hypothetical protein